MAAATKVAAFGALLRITYVALPGLRWDWRPVMWGVAILTMLAGAILAITQRDIKRMLAYSAILNAGYILLGVISTTTKGVSATLFYLAAYGFATVGAFAVVTLVRESVRAARTPATATTIRSPSAARPPTCRPGPASGSARRCWRPVSRCSCWPSPGIPLTSGFTGKFALFTAAIDGGAWPLVIVGVIASAAAAFFYVRVIVLMYFSEPLREDAGPVVVVPSPMTTIALTVSVALTDRARRAAADGAGPGGQGGVLRAVSPPRAATPRITSVIRGVFSRLSARAARAGRRPAGAPLPRKCCQIT